MYLNDIKPTSPKTAHEKLLDMGFEYSQDRFGYNYSKESKGVFSLGYDKTISGLSMNMELLQVITERCKELGWIE